MNTFLYMLAMRLLGGSGRERGGDANYINSNSLSIIISQQDMYINIFTIHTQFVWSDKTIDTL